MDSPASTLLPLSVKTEVSSRGAQQTAGGDASGEGQRPRYSEPSPSCRGAAPRGGRRQGSAGTRRRLSGLQAGLPGSPRPAFVSHSGLAGWTRPPHTRRPLLRSSRPLKCEARPESASRSHAHSCHTHAHAHVRTRQNSRSPVPSAHLHMVTHENSCLNTHACVCVGDTRAESRETSLPGPWTGPRHGSCLCGDGASWLVPTARPAPDRGQCRDCGTVSPGPAPGVCRCAAAGAWRCPASIAWARRSGSPEPGDTSLLSQTHPPNAQATSEGRV